MPDTYISQFSGEEIDAALRAAQIISGASTPAELRKKLEIRGDTIPVSAEDSTLISGAVKYRTNPNLLDNWYFGRPVNQRNGYYIPAGVKYNTLSWTEAGTTDKAYPVIGYSGQDPLITVNGTNYIVGKSAQVPGYCAVGYTVDRWWLGFDSGSSSLQLTNDGVIYNAGSSGSYENFSQPYLKESCIVGQLYTISFLVDNFQNVNQVFNNKTGSNFDITENLISYTFSYNSTPDSNPDIGIQLKKGTSTLIKAAKLELGDTQTLAHKEGDRWVLNEVPDYGEQLRRCQRYFVRLTSVYGYGWTYNSGIANFLVPLPTTMRANPVIKLTNNGEIQTINKAVAVTGFEFKGICPNGIAIDLHNSANALISGTPVTWHSASLDASADL